MGSKLLVHKNAFLSGDKMYNSYPLNAFCNQVTKAGDSVDTLYSTHEFSNYMLCSNKEIALSVRSVCSFALCQAHISYIVCDRNSKLGGWMHLGMVEEHVQFLGQYDLDLCPRF